MDLPRLAVPSQCATPDGALKEGEVEATNGERHVGTFVSMGNPHCVIFTNEEPRQMAEKYGKNKVIATVLADRAERYFSTALI